MSMSDPRINVWIPRNHEARLDQIDRQARDVEETCAKSMKLREELRLKAKSGDRAAERALAVLVDGLYEGLAEALLETTTKG